MKAHLFLVVGSLVATLGCAAARGAEDGPLVLRTPDAAPTAPTQPRFVSSRKAESAIAAELVVKGWPRFTVSCPRGVKLAKGNDFDCTVTLEDGQETRVRVVQGDDTGNVVWQTGSVIVIDTMEKKLAGNNADVEFTCPGTLIIPKKGMTLTCTSRKKGATRDVEWTVTLTDDEGNFEAVPNKK